MTSDDTTPVKLTFPDVYQGVIVGDLPSDEEISRNLAACNDYTRWQRIRRAKKLNISVEYYTALLMTGVMRHIAAEKTRLFKAGKPVDPDTPPAQRRRRNGEIKPRPRKKTEGTGVYATPPIKPIETGYLNPSYFDKFRRR
ncbi:hypothetical protein [Scandinavium manionii]|uniref:hypothetical protein n=1 Tax=Scandinavium manionii TaxID=2926520 RepID=UPI002165A751|nr:hypothetical protein [Scandinavium manionii]MCS2146797.1 hypothetical protein [Scandinavium manionii]